MWEYDLMETLCTSVWRFLTKIKIDLPRDPSMPFLGIYPKDSISYSRDTCSFMFIAALFVIIRKWKQLRYPITDEQIIKTWYIYTMEDYPD